MSTLAFFVPLQQTITTHHGQYTIAALAFAWWMRTYEWFSQVPTIISTFFTNLKLSITIMTLPHNTSLSAHDLNTPFWRSFKQIAPSSRCSPPSGNIAVSSQSSDDLSLQVALHGLLCDAPQKRFEGLTLLIVFLDLLQTWRAQSPALQYPISVFCDPLNGNKQLKAVVRKFPKASQQRTGESGVHG